jgi:AraC-like DNA-binding protein
MWTPPGFDHYHRVYGNTDVRTLQVPRALSAVLPTQPTGLRHVVTDQLTDIPEQSLYLPEPRDDWLRALTRLLYADPADASTLTELGQAVGASERTLSRLFRTELGMNFHPHTRQPGRLGAGADCGEIPSGPGDMRSPEDWHAAPAMGPPRESEASEQSL